MTDDKKKFFAKNMRENERVDLGPRTSYTLTDNPKHLGFMLARYKFVAKMFDGYDRVLEVGAGDCFGTAVVAQAVGHVDAIDIEPYGIENPADNEWTRTRITPAVHDMIKEPYGEAPFDGVYSLDVIEHIANEQEDAFLANIVKSSTPGAALVIGTPNKTAEAHASKMSKIGHINLKTFDELRELVGKYYQSVFMFGMNDEVLHTGFGAMCHYLFALGVHPRKGG